MPLINAKNGTIEFVLLAAGSSSRLGRAKQAVLVEDTPLIARQIRLLISLVKHCNNIGVSAQITCVLGYKAHAIAQLIPANYREQIRLLNNIDWQSGMGSSIAKAAKSFDDKSMMILLVDQWQLTLADLKSLVSRWIENPKSIVAAAYSKCVSEQCPVNNGESFDKTLFGPPIIFPAIYTQALTKLAGEQGAKKVALENIKHCHFVELTRAKIDLDTPNDLAYLRENFNLESNKQA